MNCPICSEEKYRQLVDVCPICGAPGGKPEVNAAAEEFLRFWESIPNPENDVGQYVP